MSQTLYAVNKLDETTPPPVTKNVLQFDFRFSTFLLYKKNVPVRARHGHPLRVPGALPRISGIFTDAGAGEIFYCQM
jgi:hypothetical protein